MVLTSIAVFAGTSGGKWVAKQALVRLFHYIADGTLSALPKGVRVTADDAVVAVMDRLIDRLLKNDQKELEDAFALLASAKDSEIQALIDDISQSAEGDEGETSAEVESRRARLANILRDFAANSRSKAVALEKIGVPGHTIPLNLLPKTADDWRRLLPDSLPSDRRPGQTAYPGMNHLTLVRLLGMGGFSEVWETRNPDDPDEPHGALKLFTRDDAENLVRKEAENIRRLNAKYPAKDHPGLVRFRHSFTANSPPGLLNELMGGGNLRHLIEAWHARTDGGPNYAEAARIIWRLCQILAPLHDRGDVHRDLKPENVLLTVDGKQKIADLGLSRIAPPDTIDRTDRTMTRMTGSGTPGYMAPEQARQAWTPSIPDAPTMDVYSLGVMFYEWIEGRIPGGALSSGMIADLRDKDVPDELIDLISECLEPDPNRRPSTAGAMERILEPFVRRQDAIQAEIVARQIAERERLDRELRDREKKAQDDAERLARQTPAPIDPPPTNPPTPSAAKEGAGKWAENGWAVGAILGGIVGVIFGLYNGFSDVETSWHHFQESRIGSSGAGGPINAILKIVVGLLIYVGGDTGTQIGKYVYIVVGGILSGVIGGFLGALGGGIVMAALGAMIGALTGTGKGKRT